MSVERRVAALKKDWAENPRWKDVTRPYSAEDVIDLRGSKDIEYTVAKDGAERFWHLIHNRPFVRALSALNGNDAIQEVEAGLEAVYISGWQVAAAQNAWGQMYPDQSLYPYDSVPNLAKMINNNLLARDRIESATDTGHAPKHWLAPLIADAEACFGGNLNSYELTRMMIESGVAAIHYEDQRSSAKKCGHMGGKVLVSRREAIDKLVAARLAADVMGAPAVLIARTDANGANLIDNDIDPEDQKFIDRSKGRTYEGFHYVNAGLDHAISRGLAYAPYADLLWCETKKADLEEAREFASAIHAQFPGMPLAYNCSPSFNWLKNFIGDGDPNSPEDVAKANEKIAEFQERLGEMGYRYQFVTLSAWHSHNHGMFQLAKEYNRTGMLAYSNLQQAEFASGKDGYWGTEHQAAVGARFFDKVQNVISGGRSSTTTDAGGSSTTDQFH